jgi:hypothetical protein
VTTGRAAIEVSAHGAAIEASHCTAIEAARRCAACTYFCSDPQELESRIAGLRSLGSGFASVRSGDGLCEKHGRYLRASARCSSFEQRVSLGNI